MKDITTLSARIEDAAFQVAHFSKTHAYPQEGTPDFFEFATLLDRLATAINAKHPAFNRNIIGERVGMPGVSGSFKMPEGVNPASPTP